MAALGDTLVTVTAAVTTTRAGEVARCSCKMQLQSFLLRGEGRSATALPCPSLGRVQELQGTAAELGSRVPRPYSALSESPH